MANIFDKDTATTDNHLLNEQFHAFSKSPSSPGSTLGGASNRSGHTVSASDVWAEKIPAFFYPKADSDYAVCKANAKLNDICRWGDEIQIWDGEKFVKFADNYAAIPDGHEFLNEDGKPVVRFHKSRVAYNLNDTNNAYDNSLDASGKGASAKILGWDKTANNGAGAVYTYVESAPQFITQFVAPTDNIVKGVPSKGYGPIVMEGGSPLTEDADSDAGYIANNFAGIIQFNKRKTQGTVTVHAFEYCGENVSDSIESVKNAVSQGVVVSVTANDAAKNAGLTIVGTANNPIINVSTGTVGGTSDAKLVTGTTVKNYVGTIPSGSTATTVVAYAKEVADAAQTATTLTAGTNVAITNKVISVATDDTYSSSSDAPISGVGVSKAIESIKKDSTTSNGITYSQSKGIVTIDAATATGTATGTVKLSDATTGTSGVSGGIAATPKAVSDALTAAKNAIKIDSVKVGSSALPITDKAVTIPTASAGGTGVGLVTLGSTNKLDGNASSTSSKAATEAAVAKAIASLESTIGTIMGTGVNYAVLGDGEALPTASKDLLGWIYLKKDTTSAAGEYLEYICVNKGTATAPAYEWEQIGSTKVDHAAYAKQIALGSETVTVSNNVASLAGKVVTGVTPANGVSGTVDTSTGKVRLTVQDATSAQKGIVTLSSHDAIAAATGSTDTKVATVGAVAATIAGLDVTGSTAANNKGLAWSQADGKVSIGLTTATVATDGTITNGGYLTTANDAQKLVSAAIGALDVAETSSNGITWSQTDGTVSISISADETPTYGSNRFVTSKGIQSAIAAAKAAATTKVEKASTTVTDDVTSTTNTNGSTTYTIDTLSDVTITREDTGSASMVVGNRLIFNNGTIKYADWKYVDWSRVTVAEGAFQNSNIEAFHADLENLTNGKNMFNGSRALKSFCGNLSSLTDGTDMFKGCALDLESVMYIVDSLPTPSDSKTHNITIGVDKTLVTDDDIAALTAELADKGWGDSVIDGTDTTE